MKIEYEDAVKVQRQIEDVLLKNPNVVSIGVRAEIDNFGQKTRNYVIQVGVESSKAYWSDQKSGRFVIPEKYRLHTNDGLKEIKIQIKREGKIYPHANISKLFKRDFSTSVRKPLFALTKYQSNLSVFKGSYVVPAILRNNISRAMPFRYGALFAGIGFFSAAAVLNKLITDRNCHARAVKKF